MISFCFIHKEGRYDFFFVLFTSFKRGAMKGDKRAEGKKGGKNTLGGLGR